MRETVPASTSLFIASRGARAEVNSRRGHTELRHTASKPLVTPAVLTEAVHDSKCDRRVGDRPGSMREPGAVRRVDETLGGQCAVRRQDAQSLAGSSVLLVPL